MWLLVVLLGIPQLLAGPASCHDTSQPNIVFIMADDLGFNDVGYHQSEIRTPNIDQISAEGVRLENYYVQPICSPSRSQFMSGRYQIHTGLQHGVILPTQPLALPLDSPTLAEKLKEVGYSTYAVGKWHLGYYKRKYLPTRRGFDKFFGFYTGKVDYFKHRRCLFGHCAVDLHNDTPDGFTNVFNETGTYSTHLYTNKAIDWISEHDTNKPFFMYLAYQAVHGPLQAPSFYKKQYKYIPGFKRRFFAAMTTAMDEGVGKVVAALKDKGVWNNTVLVFSTDNGGEPGKGGSNYPLRGHKGLWLEGGVRGVGFVASPLLQQTGYSNQGLMHISDWYPTFIRLANGSLNGTRDIAGIDQWDTISTNVSSERHILLHGIDPISMTAITPKGKRNNIFDIRISAAIRIGDYKLITGTGPKKTRKRLKARIQKNRNRQRRISTARPFRMRKRQRNGKFARRRWPSFIRMRLVRLYNIRKDPREQNDLARQEVAKVYDMLHKLRDYYRTSVPALDPAPERVWPVNGAWGPWKD